MAVLSRPRFLPQQRLDLEDLNALLSALRTDSKLYTKKIVSSENLVFSGFTVSGIGLKAATVDMSDATFVVPLNSFDFSWFTSAPGEANIVIPDASLTDNARNYVELSLVTSNNTPLSKAFWDPEAASGAGAEFNQIVDTITDLSAVVSVSTGGFTGSANTIPLCIIDTDNSGTIKVILDQRPLFGRLGLPTNIDNNFSWASNEEPPYTIALTGGSGTYTVGETVTFTSGATAEVVIGGTTSITIKTPSGTGMKNGDTLVGGTSAASRTVNTILESFTGADKDLGNLRKVINAIQSELKRIKGTRFWHQAQGNSLQGISTFLNSCLVGLTAGARYHWSGTTLSITDDSGGPANADALAKLRLLGKSQQLSLTRQDGTGGSTTISISDGQVVYIKLPSSGDRSYSGVGSGNTNYIVANYANFSISDDNYWIAIREGSKLYVRGYGELMTGESAEISDPISKEILTFIGATSEADTAPSYSSVTVVSQGGSLVAAIGQLDAGLATQTSKINQNRTMKLVKGGTWSWDQTNGILSWSSSAYVQIGALADAVNEISSSTATLNADGKIAYISVKRTSGSSTRAVSVVDIASLTLTDDIKIIARRVGNDILIGESFLLKDTEKLELDGALTEINRYNDPLKIISHPTSLNKVKINAADKTFLDSNIGSQELNGAFLNFDGAVINFTSGAVLASDDVTALGTNFTPFTIPSGQYFWYAIGVTKNITGADNRNTAVITVTSAASANAVSASAPFPSLVGAKKIGAVLVRNNAGSIEVVQIRRLSTVSVTIDSNSIANSQLATMVQSTIKGRAAGAGTGDPQDLTATQATAILNNMVGDSGSGGTKGLVPAPAAGDAAAGKVLSAAGTWATTGVSTVQSYLDNALQGYVDLNSYVMTATATTGTPAAGVFHSGITNRASMIDFRKDLRARMGVTRLMIYDLFSKEWESGPNAEPVQGAQNDAFDQIRVVGGGWVPTVGQAGFYIASTLVDEYIEIVFYGTEISGLFNLSVNSMDARVRIDGAAEGSNIFQASYRTSLTTQNTNCNQILPLATGLALGVHTIKLRNNSTNSMGVYGFEIVNNSASVSITQGDSYKKGSVRSTAATSFAYTAPVTGVRGGRVLVYQDNAGAIQKAWTATNGAAAYLTSTDHTNEEIADTYNVRQMGMARSNDWTVSSGSGILPQWTSDDNTHNLKATNGGGGQGVQLTNGYDYIGTNSNTGNGWVFTFVGTGCDILRMDSATTTPTMDVTIDGTSQGTLSSTGVTQPRIIKICSGLPYGTHTVKISISSVNSGTFGIMKFFVYQPITPALPADCVAIAAYNVLATFVANASSTKETIATGVLRKHNTKEQWGTVAITASGVNVDETSGFAFQACTSGYDVFYTFWGTGFDYRFIPTAAATAPNFTVSINGLAPTSANFSGATTGSYGNVTSFTQSTGAVITTATGTANHSGVYVSNMPLGYYTVKILLTNSPSCGSGMYSGCFDIITPIHSHSYFNGFVCPASIEDKRNIVSSKVPAANRKGFVYRKGLISGAAPNSTTFVPAPDQHCKIETNGGPLMVSWVCEVPGPGSVSRNTCTLFVDGRQYGTQLTGAGGSEFNCFWMVPNLPAGRHNIAVYVHNGGSGTITMFAQNRELTVVEL